jgi:uracil-DNA glycosylase family 4
MVNDTATFPTIVTSRRSVPNEHPIIEPTAYRIALVGEAPGEDEENHRRPFVGKSGQFLTNLLRDVGIDRHQCLMANVCQYRPPANRIEAFAWDGIEIQEGLAKLREDIRVYNPNICVLLGNTPLRSARGVCKITDWRGSLFKSDDILSPFFGRKCVASLHPAFVLREFSGFPLLKFDLKRAADEGRTPTLDLPKRELITAYDASTLCYIMDSWPTGQRCSIDIEGGLGGWPCVSVAARPTKSITIAWGKLNEDSHVAVLRSFSKLMFRKDVPKVLQNSLYDNFVLSFAFGIPIRNVVEDTMLKGWEVYCELPKGLATQTSIWTREPFYKADRKSDNAETFFEYCAKDSAVTLEICNAQDNVLTGQSLQHYRKNVEMLNPLLYMELRGIKYDQENVTKELEATRKEFDEVGNRLCETGGTELRGPKGSLSAKRLAQCLYVDKKYPPQYKKEFGRKTDELTTDVEALLHLRKKLPMDEFLNGILKHRHLEGIIETLNIRPDPDGRVRCGYNVVGTETGRLTCYTSPTGAGANLQTITKKLRKNYVADTGYDFFQCDLSGADGWTVAAHCKRLGDPTMLEDYYFGLKPAKIIVLMKDLGADVNMLDRDSLKNACRVVDPDGWEYFAGKRIQHSGNYLAGIPTTMTIVMKDSYKLSGTPIYLDHGTTGLLQGYYFTRYKGVKTWHAWAESKLVADGKLTSASGQTRIFFGRRFGNNIHDTVKEFLAHEPQSNTTWATNLAMLNLWNDPENRRNDGSLVIEPLHQVHDALCGQWPQSCRDWARTKIRTYFNNKLTIAGTDIIIPFEGRFGRSWGELTEEI